MQERAAQNAEERLLESLLPGGTEEGRGKMRDLLAAGKLEDPHLRDRSQRRTPALQMMMPGMEEMGMNLQDMMSNFMPKKRSKRQTER